MLQGKIGDLGRALISDVENVYNLESESDVVFTVLNVCYVIDEADVQVEIRYTAGEDEYEVGDKFNDSYKKVKDQDGYELIIQTLLREKVKEFIMNL